MTLGKGLGEYCGVGYESRDWFRVIPVGWAMKVVQDAKGEGQRLFSPLFMFKGCRRGLPMFVLTSIYIQRLSSPLFMFKGSISELPMFVLTSIYIQRIGSQASCFKCSHISHIEVLKATR